jgi:hypothetical protein
MDIFQKLTVITCVTSSATLMLVFVAVLPHVKHGMTLVRDSILWMACAAVIVGLVWLSWRRLSDTPLILNRRSDVTPATLTRPTSDTDPLTAADPYFAGGSSP